MFTQVASADDQEGVAPPAAASPVSPTSTTPSRCPAESSFTGTTWHVAHGTAADRPDAAFRWAWCAPTDGSAVSVRPWISTGGAGLSALPWQALQFVDDRTCSIPSMCVDASASPPSTVAVGWWQVPQCATWGCGAGGGLPWQAVQAMSASLGGDQTGAWTDPPASVAPWQYTFTQAPVARS